MTEIEKLLALREKLVANRRGIVESYQRASGEQITGDTLTHVQHAIDALDRAIEDERRLTPTTSPSQPSPAHS
jgi:hypothetical protein